MKHVYILTRLLLLASVQICSCVQDHPIESLAGDCEWFPSIPVRDLTIECDDEVELQQKHEEENSVVIPNGAKCRITRDGEKEVLWKVCYSGILEGPEWTDTESYKNCCGPHRYMIGCKCIVVSTVKRNWGELVEFCRDLGGHLAVVDSAGTLDGMRDIMREHYASEWAARVDGTDKENEGTWVVWDGSSLPYTNWNPQQPNNIVDQDYLFIHRDWDYKMADGNFDEKTVGLCEL